jgi:hypothetical protein
VNTWFHLPFLDTPERVHEVFLSMHGSTSPPSISVSTWFPLPSLGTLERVHEVNETLKLVKGIKYSS